MIQRRIYPADSLRVQSRMKSNRESIKEQMKQSERRKMLSGRCKKSQKAGASSHRLALRQCSMMWRKEPIITKRLLNHNALAIFLKRKLERKAQVKVQPRSNRKTRSKPRTRHWSALPIRSWCPLPPPQRTSTQLTRRELSHALLWNLGAYSRVKHPRERDSIRKWTSFPLTVMMEPQNKRSSSTGR